MSAFYASSGYPLPPRTIIKSLRGPDHPDYMITDQRIIETCGMCKQSSYSGKKSEYIRYGSWMFQKYLVRRALKEDQPSTSKRAYGQPRTKSGVSIPGNVRSKARVGKDGYVPPHDSPGFFLSEDPSKAAMPDYMKTTSEQVLRLMEAGLLNSNPHGNYNLSDELLASKSSQPSTPLKLFGNGPWNAMAEEREKFKNATRLTEQPVTQPVQIEMKSNQIEQLRENKKEEAKNATEDVLENADGNMGKNHKTDGEQSSDKVINENGDQEESEQDIGRQLDDDADENEL